MFQSHFNHMDFYDRFYGKLEFKKDDIRLFQTRELVRLRQVSLSAIPPWALPTSTSATKFEHTLGVAYLAKIVGKKSEFRDSALDLYFAALAHDLGTPPFSHAAEYFQIKLLGKNHEEFVDDVLEASEFAQEVERQGGSVKKIIKLVKGEDKPISDIINGSIDIDNIDNSLRYGISMGLLHKHLYIPRELANAFGMQNGTLYLKAESNEGIRRWEECRKKVYRFVYSSANLAPAMMLFRALDFAFREEELSRDFFLMMDAEAFLYLEKKCNVKTRRLIERIKRWQFYPRAYNFSSTQPTSKQKQLIENLDNRSDLSDSLCKHMKTSPENICIYVGTNKAYKKISFPLIDRQGNEIKYSSQLEQKWRAQVYTHPQLMQRVEEVRDYMEGQLQY